MIGFGCLIRYFRRRREKVQADTARKEAIALLGQQDYCLTHRVKKTRSAGLAKVSCQICHEEWERKWYKSCASQEAALVIKVQQAKQVLGWSE